MTNVEKAIEISNAPAVYMTDFNLEKTIELQRYNAAMLMAEWKDEQFKESVNKAMKYLETNLQLTEAESTHICKLFNF